MWLFCFYTPPRGINIIQHLCPILEKDFMDTSKFKNIVGEVQDGQPATIRFFGRINEQSAKQFNEEFDYLEGVVRPSLIRVLINSEGGSVLHGMSAYATIQNSSIPTECINEGMAASMGSVLWAAGDRSLMRDYSILMIHNPFILSADDVKSGDMVLAFTKQIRMIYRKRFGLPESHVESIMTGAAGKDGTYFDAAGAIQAGIISPDNVLHTSKQLCEKVRNELSGLNDNTAIQDMMVRISAEAGGSEVENKPSEIILPILNQTLKHNERMSEPKTISAEYSAVVASLGLKDNYEVKDVMSRISELLSIEAKLKEAERDLTDSKTVIVGKEAAVKNLQINVNELTASLKVYQDKEALETKTRNQTMVDQAEAAGKIDKADVPKWIEMAESNFSLTENILASIPAREKITTQIASDPSNVKAAADAAKTTEQKLAEEVSAVVGEKFEFKKIGKS